MTDTYAIAHQWLFLARVDTVVDGDTLKVTVDVGFHLDYHTEIRLARVNCPETHRVSRSSEEYAKGLLAKQCTADWVARQQGLILAKTVKWEEKYGRWLAEVYSRDGLENLSDVLIAAGHDKNTQAA